VTSRPLQAVLLPPSQGGRVLAALAAALDGSGPAILPLDPATPAPALRRVLETLAPSSLLTMEGTGPAPGAPRSGSAAGVAEDTAVVIATSGSTGEPKGVELTAAAMTASAASSLRRLGARGGERWLCCLPTFHIAGLGVLVRSLVSGTDPVITAKAGPQTLTASECEFVSLVPTQLRRFLDAGGAGPGGRPAGAPRGAGPGGRPAGAPRGAGPPPALRAVLLGGAAAAGDLLASATAAGWPVVTTYGMSETCGGCVYDGLPLDGVRAVPAADGRIEISGLVLFSGYRLAPELTAAALTGGRFRTSDLGYLAADGRLVVRGRADDVINTGGEKVVPGEVEAALGTSPAVADVVVVGVPDAQWGEQVTAFVVPADAGSPPDLGHLTAIVRQALSVHAAPKKVFVMPVFPLLPSGKPDRAALRASAMRKLGVDEPEAGAQ
jgi:o-succinylbenzoate---CoA ligase